MMKEIRRFLFTVATALVSLSASAYDFEVDGLCYNVLSKESLTCEVAYSSEYKDFKSVTVPATVQYNGFEFTVTTIGDQAFVSGKELLEVVLPQTITKIDFGAFRGCQIASIDLPSSITDIETYAFANCKNLERIAIPAGVKSIKEGTFFLCESLGEIDIHANIESIGRSAFREAGLNSLALPASVTSIEGDAFKDCKYLKSIAFSEGLVSVGHFAFSSCISLVEVSLPRSLKKVPFCMFYNCTNLKKIVLSNEVEVIESSAFSDCPNITEIVSLNATPPSAKSTSFENVSKIECLVKVPNEAIAEYKAADIWKEFWKIEGIDETGGDIDKDEKCEIPQISVNEGKIIVSCTTQGATCHTTIVCDDQTSFNSQGSSELPLTGQYHIKSYATADGKYNSDMASAVLVWVNPSIYDPSSVISMEAKKAVVIKSVGGQVVVCGTERGEHVALFTLDGRELVSMRASDGETALPCNLPNGEIVIVRYGDKSVKVKL